MKDEDFIALGEGAVLAHFGVRGMKWGVRKGVGTPSAKSGSDSAPPSRAKQAAKTLVKSGGIVAAGLLATNAVAYLALSAAASAMDATFGIEEYRANKAAGVYDEPYSSIKED